MFEKLFVRSNRPVRARLSAQHGERGRRGASFASGSPVRPTGREPARARPLGAELAKLAKFAKLTKLTKLTELTKYFFFLFLKKNIY